MTITADRGGELAVPLVTRAAFRTRDPAVASREAGRLFAEHRLRVLGDRSLFDARAHVADLGDVRLNFVTFGSGVEIDRFATDTYSAVLIPISGRLGVEHDGGSFIATPKCGTAVLLGAGRIRLRWTADCRVLSFYLTSGRLGRHLTRLTPAVDPGPLSFSTGLLSGNSAAALLGLAWLITDTFNRCGARRVPLAPVVAQLRDTVLNAVLLGVPHSHSRAMFVSRPLAGRGLVDRAIELIDAETDGGELTLTEVAEHVGVGLRALELAFRRDLDTAPGQYLRDVRLRRARQELLDGGPASGLRVQDVAQRWGFFHTGRFSRLYWERFGEYPSVTLMRR